MDNEPYIPNMSKIKIGSTNKLLNSNIYKKREFILFSWSHIKVSSLTL